MSQEGANLPQEMEGSHDQATSHHGSIPAGVGSPTAIVTPVGSNPSSVSKLASAVDNAGSSEPASPVVPSAGEDNNSSSSKIASPAVLHAGDDNTAAFKIASPAVLLAGEENKKGASSTVLVAGEEKGNDAVGSKLASPVVLHAGDDNTGESKIAGLAVPHAIVDDNTTGSKLNSRAAPLAGEHNNPPALHASKDMENNTGQPKFASPLLFHAGGAKKARTTKRAIQAVPHAGGNAGSSRLTRSATRHASSVGSKLAIQVAPRPHAGKDINAAGSSKAARPAAVDAGKSNAAKDGKKTVTGEKRARDEADVGGGSGNGNAAAAGDADHELHIFTERERRKKMKTMFSTLHGLLPQLPHKADKSTIVGEAVTYIKTLEGTLQRLEKLKQERLRALAAQQQQQQQLVAAAGAGSTGASSARHPAPAPALPAPPVPAPAPASSREASLADMVHAWEAQAQQAAVAAANKALVDAAAAGAGGSSSSAAPGPAPAPALPRGPVPFPAPAAGFQTWTGHNVVVSVANNEAFINLYSPRQPGTLTKALFVLERHRIATVATVVSAQDGFRMYGIHARVNPAPASARFPENLCAEDRFKLAVSEIIQLINMVV